MAEYIGRILGKMKANIFYENLQIRFSDYKKNITFKRSFINQDNEEDDYYNFYTSSKKEITDLMQMYFSGYIDGRGEKVFDELYKWSEDITLATTKFLNRGEAIDRGEVGRLIDEWLDKFESIPYDK